MSFLRLATRCAVINEAGEILLSKRGDFGTWALPGGRLDNYELLPDSAVREVREETGLHVEIESAAGLYYQQGRSRMNVLYRARPVGGELLQSTDETLANQFFAPDNLPDNRFGQIMIDHAYQGGTHLYTVEISPLELLKLQYKLSLRWIQNLLAGRPEPKFPHFEVHAVGIVRDKERETVLSEDGKLPRIISDGSQPPHEALNQRVKPFCENVLRWQWVGLWQNTALDKMAFIYSTQAEPVPTQREKWKTPHDFLGRDKLYLERELQPHGDVWLIESQQEQ